MLAVKSMDVRDNFKEWCNKVINGETLIVSRPKNENVVIVSEEEAALPEEYNNLLKAKRNEEYLKKLDHSFAQLDSGEVVHKSLEELRAMIDE